MSDADVRKFSIKSFWCHSSQFISLGNGSNDFEYILYPTVFAYENIIRLYLMVEEIRLMGHFCVSMSQYISTGIKVENHFNVFD